MRALWAMVVLEAGPGISAPPWRSCWIYILYSDITRKKHLKEANAATAAFGCESANLRKVFLGL